MREWEQTAQTDSVEFCHWYRPTVAHPQRGMVPFVPYPYQEKLLWSLDLGGPHVVLKARQTGISTVVMVQKLRRCLDAGTTVLVVSRKDDTAAELVRIARDAVQGCNPAYPLTVTKDNQSTLAFSNGSRIIAETSTPNTGRTFAASDVVFDEFAFLPWQEEMWRSVRPTVSRGGNVCIVSTPDMEGDLFELRWQEAQAQASIWKPHRVHWRDCPEYVASPDWYNSTRPDYTADEWAQEFECEFGRASDAVFRSAYIQRAVELAEAEYQRVPRPTFAVGGDLAGEGRDASVLVALDVSERPARVVDVRSWEVLPAPSLQAEVQRIAADYAAKPWLDRTGIGWGIVQNLSCPAVGLAITGGTAQTGTHNSPNVPRTLLINNLVLALEQEQLAIPVKQQELLMGLRTYRWDKRNGSRADWVDALAIAWWSHTHQPPALLPPGGYYARNAS